MIKDAIKSGNGKKIVQAAYDVLRAIEKLPKHRQVQAVATIFLAIVEVLKLKPWEILDSTSRIIKSEENYATTKGLFGYIEEELKDV